MILTTDIRSPADAPLETRHRAATEWDLLDIASDDLEHWPQRQAPDALCGLVLTAREIDPRPELPASFLRRIVLTCPASPANPDETLQQLCEAALCLRWACEAGGVDVLLRPPHLPVTARTAATLIETVNSPRVRWELDARGIDHDALAAQVRLLDWRLGGVVVDPASLPDHLPGLLDEIGFNGFLHSDAGDAAAGRKIRAWANPVAAHRREA